LEITGDRKRGDGKERDRWSREREALNSKTEIGIKSVLEMELMLWGQGVLGSRQSQRGRGHERKGMEQVRLEWRNGVKGQFFKRIQPSGEIERQIES
jgi:hypothetical protein